MLLIICAMKCLPLTYLSCVQTLQFFKFLPARLLAIIHKVLMIKNLVAGRQVKNLNDLKCNALKLKCGLRHVAQVWGRSGS